MTNYQLQILVWYIDDLIIQQTVIVYLILSLPETRFASHNTDLHSSSNIPKTVGVNVVFKETFFRVIENLSNAIQVDRLCVCDSLVIDV